MKFNLEQNIIGFDGLPILENDKPVSYQEMLGRILVLGKEGDTAEIKSKLFQICIKLFAGEASEVDFTADQITIINERVGEFASPLILGRVKELLDPEDKIGV